MNGIVTNIYTRADSLPQLEEGNFFHSRQLFVISSQTPRQKPYMVTCTDNNGCLQSQMLAIVRYRTSCMPPFFFMHCRIYGEGIYTGNKYPKDELFGTMLHAITTKLNKTALYIEVSHLSSKMFGYRQFRKESYFPVHWMNIHNSLHSRTPEERITDKKLSRIENAYSRGVTIEQVSNEDDFMAFMKLLHQHHWLKPKRYIPDDQFFKISSQTNDCRLFVTKYRQHVIGCSACVYSGTNAYLWYTAFRRKSYLSLHPDDVTIWHAIKYAYDQGYAHINFIDVGLPFSKNPFREFILSFGGKPTSSYRWFRCSISWINSLLSWFYRG